MGRAWICLFLFAEASSHIPCGAAASSRNPQAEAPAIVVTTSLLECAAREIAPATEKLRVVRLMPPAACPGHFDLSPRVLLDLRDARLLARHDFQSGLDAKLHELTPAGCLLLVATGEGSLLIPARYQALVEQMGTMLAQAFPEHAAEFVARRNVATARLTRLEKTLQERMQPLRGAPVVASIMQRDLCQWLGLSVVGEIKRPEDITPKDMAALLQLRPRAVVGNLQSDGAAASALAWRMDVPCVVWSNFPGADGYGETYEQLMLANLNRLENVCRKP